MRNKLTKIAFSAGLWFAMAFALSCSGSDDNPDNKGSSPPDTPPVTLPSSNSQNGIILGEPVIYDGKTYKTIIIGDYTWMAENLNYNAPGSKCYGEGENEIVLDEYGRPIPIYDEDGNFIKDVTKPKYSPAEIQAFCDKYGRLYDGETAATACPTGWHLSSRDEWWTLVESNRIMDGGGTKLKATNGWNEQDGISGNGTDVYGFSALPGGRGNPYSSYSYGPSYEEEGDYGYWWNSVDGYYSVLGLTDDISGGVQYSATMLHSVRCVKN